MATTVNIAFAEFLRDHVNLSSSVVKNARGSRDWLLEQIHLLPSRHSDFPVLYSDVDIHYGSFARRTKIRPLDDLDMIVGISALGTTYFDYGGTVKLLVPDGIALRRLCHDGTALLNSRRVINKFVKHLEDVPQYEKSEIKRNESAAVLRLRSHDWNFDIVPCFFTTPEYDGRTYYIIPDGNGHWMKTDPRIDQERTTTLNQAHDGNILNVVRAIKYWNRQAGMPTIRSYLFESIILDHYERLIYGKASSYVDIEVEPVLTHIATAILSSVQDPKRIQGDINDLAWSERVAISSSAREHAEKASRARAAENAGDHKSSINIWREIFGSNFPTYG